MTTAAVNLWGTAIGAVTSAEDSGAALVSPGPLADSLTDKRGEALIKARLASRGRSPGTFSPVERLCYVGKRGMGALEYEPVEGPDGRCRRHQMSVNGKRDNFGVEDSSPSENRPAPSRARAGHPAQGHDVVSRWPAYAERGTVPERLADVVTGDLRLTFHRD